MLRNYLLVAIRNATRNGSYSLINFFGLTLGLACAILIFLWVYDELSYNKFHSNIEKLHQVWINSSHDGKINTFQALPLAAEQALKDSDDRIQHIATTDWGSEHLLTVKENRFNKQGYYTTDQFLEMFRFPLLSGNPETVLDDPYSIVITESTARTLFGHTNVLNEYIRVDNANDLKVTGVTKDIPQNSSFAFDFLLPFSYYEVVQPWVKQSRHNWKNYGFQIFVKLKSAQDQQAVEQNIKDLLTKNGETDIKRDLFLHPMSKWRLESTFENGKASGGMIDYVRIFSVVAIFILIIACINFMNLATARSERRAREVGVRKSIGSPKRQLIIQFLTESIVMSAIAFGASILLVEILLPYYNTLTSKSISIDYSNKWFWVAAVATPLLTGIIAGSYPAFYLSSFKPVEVLKGKIRSTRFAATPRQVLVVLQFIFSITLIVCSIVIQKQIAHLKNRNIGYNQENLITIDYTDEIGKNYNVIKQELLGSGVVESVTKSNSPITSVYSNNFLDWPGKPEEQKVAFATIGTEYDYTKTMGIKMLEGRDFSEDFPSDTTAIIINKAALDLMGLKDPIGTTVKLWSGERKIIGVMDNVLMGSVFRDVQPTMCLMMPWWTSAITLRLSKTNDLQTSLLEVEKIFKKYNAAYPFEFSFVDQEFEKKFSTINMVSNLGNIFTVLAICITGLGLFGLASFTAEQRTKEIGIRKVLGASIVNVVVLISREFSVLVCISFTVSAPIALWASKTLLEKYAYRINFPTWVIPTSGILCLMFALIIVSTQALRAARSNPVKALRSE
jgi:putative ABC transport system permease protein